MENVGKQRATKFTIYAIILVSFVLRLLLLRVDRIVRWDEPDYLLMGINLFSGRGLTVGQVPELHYAPLFPIVTGTLGLVLGDAKRASDLCYLIFGTLLPLCTYLVARRTSGTTAALITAALVGVFPPLSAGVLFWGTMIEPMYVVLLLTALYAWFRALDTNLARWHLGAGVLLGLAYLTKPEALLHMAFLWAIVTLYRLATRTMRDRRTITNLALAALAFIMVISPYIAYLYRYTGRVLLSGKLGVTYAAGLGVVIGDPVLYDRELARLDEAGEHIIWFSPDRFKYSLLDYIRQDPRLFLYRTWHNFNALEQSLFSHQAFPFYLLGLVALAWFARKWDQRRVWSMAMLLAFCLPLASFLPFHIELRYFAPLFPVLLLWVAEGITELGHWWRETVSNLMGHEPHPAWLALGTRLPAFALCALFLALQPFVVANGLADMNPAPREAGLWLKANTPPETLLMTRDTQVPFYAERPWIPSANEPYERLIHYARKNRVQYWVVDEREVTVIRPQLSFLADTTNPPPELEFVRKFSGGKWAVIVYRLVAAP
ncbi:MAG: glycosyltransferase family 39 protein [Chloroflexi bacterium]|nr:glycosyltransferase family 39 protein [Chloroflexota bacterium]